jgi:hypothetical protein
VTPRSALPLLLATIVTLLLCGPVSASAAQHGRRGHPSVRIASPKADTQIGASVVVRVRARGRQFRALLDGRDVSRRFHRDGAMRTARLKLGRDYHLGDVSLLVTIGAGRRARSDLDYFYALRRRDRSAKLRLSWDRRRHASPLMTLRTRRPIRSVHAWLNGHPVDREFKSEDEGHRIFARLAPHSGLRYGHDHVVFRVVERGGILARVSRGFKVRRGRPLADAGRNRRVGVGHAVMLDSSATLPESRGGAGLEYHWWVLRAPSGSDAKVTAATAPRARFVPDVPGNYELRLAVSDAAGHESLDETEIEAPQKKTAMGLPIQTRTKDGGIQIGKESWGPRGDWVQMLVLNDRNAVPQTGPWDERDGNGGFKKEEGRGFSIGESSALLEAVKQTTSGQLVILSGQPCACGPNQEAASNLTAAIELLGGTVQTWGGPTPHGAEDLWQTVEGHWSLIGHKGLARAAADQNIGYGEAGIPGFLGGEAGQPGSLNGYLQEVTTLGYEYVSPENVSLDTKWAPSVSTPPSATQNTIAVGAQHYQSATVSAGTIAIQLLLLDPSSLQLVSNETFEVIEANGTTAFAGIHKLDAKLHEINTDHSVGYSPLIVLQDFGKHEGWNWPGGNSTDWLEDTLPGTEDSREWSGNPFPNNLGQLLHSWNQANPLGTVAGNLGELVSSSFHDAVANYRRPYFNPAANGGAGAVVSRNTGGLTMVAEPHLYQLSSAFGQGQANPALSGGETIGNGRVTGTLTRDEQSQWQLSDPANGAGFEVANPSGESDNLLDPEALWDLVFQPSVPWPCSFQHPEPCPRSPKQIAEADRYIAGRLFNHNVLDVREMYEQEESWAAKATKLKEEVKYEPGQGFSRAVFSALTRQLTTEFHDLEEVRTGIKSWESVIGTAGSTANFNAENAAGKVIGEVQKAEAELATHEAEINAASTTSDGLLVVSSVIEYALAGGALPEDLAFGPPMLGGLSAMIALGDDLFGEDISNETRPSESQQSVPDNTDAIRDTVSNLGLDLRARYSAVNATMGHFQDVFATDWGKLSKAAENFSTDWSLNSKEEKLIAQSFSVSAERQLYATTIPMAFSQWIISPRKTDINKQAGVEFPVKEYQCRKGQNYYFAYKVNEWEPVGGETSVLWTGGNPGPNDVPYTIRFLKPWADNMETETTNNLYDEGGHDTLIPNPGGNPSEALLNPLFEPVSVSESPMFPRNLGMNKDEFFGQPWGMQQLQCGLPEGEE